MNPKYLQNRRQFVRATGAATTALGLGDLSFISRLAPVSAQEAHVAPDAVQFDAGIEPLVRLLEETPRDKLLEEFAAGIDRGTSYREVLTALLLAGIRNIPPRPDVGWKFHAVLCINSAHLASMASPPGDRWLPIFYALDFFKGQQMYDERESDWSLGKVNESAIPRAHKSLAAFNRAMDNWEDDAADAAVTGLVRSAGAADVFERCAWYGMRDFRNIGHKEIYTANSWRLLQCIGWRHSEPVVRSLVYALLNHHDEPNPSTSDLEADKPWKQNIELVDEIRDDWLDGENSSEATSDLLATMRSGGWAEASQQVVDLLNSGISPQSIRDALYAGASELLSRQPGIYSLHAVTATNAMGYAFRMTGNDRTRRMLLLQNAAFIPQFRDYLKTEPPEQYRVSQANWDTTPIDQLIAPETDATGDEALADIFGRISADPTDAVGPTLGFLQGDADRARDFVDAARRLVFLKTRNSHDYKFSSAIMEDYHQISPEWRDRCLATSVYYLPGTSTPDNKLVQRTRAALGQ